MPKKLSIDFVKSKFEEIKYTLLTTEYKNAHQKLEYICSEGHKESISWNHFQQGQGCAVCSKNKKKTIEFIKNYFEEVEYRLLTKEYKGAHKKLDYICPEGHRGKITWANFQQGQRCRKCSEKKRSMTQRTDIEFIRLCFEEKDYQLLTKKYKNNRQKLEYICSEGHRGSISWTHFQKGQGCPICYRKNNSGENHYNWLGGISCEPYCDVWLDKEFKESIKERDNYTCMNPSCWGTSNRLCIHHINYIKKDCRPNNLITLCISCNSRANKDREYWQEYYELRNIWRKK